MMRRAPMKRTAIRRQGARLSIGVDRALPGSEATVLVEIAPGRPPRIERWLAGAPAAPIFRPQPKTSYVRDEGYLRAVAALPCYRCGIEGYSNACHSDAGAAGKGERIKACDLTCWPGCVARPGIPGCHAEVGTLAVMPRAEREAFELRAAAATRATLIAQSSTDHRLRVVLERVGLLERPPP